jgi:hypothetical protein
VTSNTSIHDTIDKKLDRNLQYLDARIKLLQMDQNGITSQVKRQHRGYAKYLDQELEM